MGAALEIYETQSSTRFSSCLAYCLYCIQCNSDAYAKPIAYAKLSVDTEPVVDTELVAIPSSQPYNPTDLSRQCERYLDWH